MARDGSDHCADDDMERITEVNRSHLDSPATEATQCGGWVLRERGTVTMGTVPVEVRERRIRGPMRTICMSHSFQEWK